MKDSFDLAQQRHPFTCPNRGDGKHVKRIGRDLGELVEPEFGDGSLMCPDCDYRQRGAPDLVNHPPHYKLGTMEVIDAIEGLGLEYHAGNVVKYVARYKAKGGVDDLRKARWYLDRLIERESK